jgi:hypothetical protein
MPPLRLKTAMTDVLATWLKKGFVAGPFKQPPCDGFRANPLMAAVQKNKVQPILNLSFPKGSSFNDAVKETKISLLGMISAKIFGEALKKWERDQFSQSKISKTRTN